MDFNPTRETDDGQTRNYEGGEAYEPSTPEMRLTKRVINNLLEPTYYEEATASLDRTLAAFDACADENPAFIGKLAAYAQQEMGLRDISTLLLVAAANDERTQSDAWVRERATEVLTRPDDLTTAVAMNDTLTDTALPVPLRDAINRALHTFDAYQYAKYDTSRREYNLRDVVNRTHPVPQDDERADIFARLIRGPLDADGHEHIEPLETPETWEATISEMGNTPEAWREVLPRLGLFAKIRNVRNMRECGLDGDEIFGDEDMEHVRNSLFFPFRFYQAYRAVADAGLADDATEAFLTDAIDETVANVPDFESTVVAVDTSGSMNAQVSGRSSFTCVGIASFFGAVLSQNGADVIAFAEDAEPVEFHSGTPTVERVRTIADSGPGGSTNGWKVLVLLTEMAQAGDARERVVYLTDMQLWDSGAGMGHRERTVRDEWDRYRGVATDARLYMVDLLDYGDLTTPQGHPEVVNIAGWTPRIIDYIEHAEAPGAMVETIEAYEAA